MSEDYFCSVCDEDAQYMINFAFSDLDNHESMNKAGWYCWKHVTEKMDDFVKKCVEHISDNAHE